MVVAMAEVGPTAEELRHALREVRADILDIVTAIEDIRLQQFPQIYNDYAIKIGCWEKELLEAEVAARRSKRRYALMQAQVNQGNAPQYENIETQLDEEFADWTERAEEAQAAYEQALAWHLARVPMAPADTEELHKLYRTLMKRLHPDVHVGEDEKRAEYFALAQNAYRDGDLKVLRSLETATRRFDPKDDLEGEDNTNALATELELQEVERSAMQKQLEELENSEDMQLGKLLQDPDWVTARTEELKAAVEQWESVQREYDARVARLKEAIDGR